MWHVQVKVRYYRTLLGLWVLMVEPGQVQQTTRLHRELGV